MEPIDQNKARRRRRLPSSGGFTLIDTLVTVAVFCIASAIAVPTMAGAVEGMRVRMAARDVERELQSARLLAVSSNRPIRVRFNCPEAGQYRMVELIGSPESPDVLDGDGSRCGESAFPYPARDNDPLTRPNLDGPLRRLPPGVSFDGAQTVEFWPNGTARVDAGSGTPWPKIRAAGTAISLTKGAETLSIEVNGRGKIHLE